MPYEPLLIDATLALLMKIGGESLVIPTLNRGGDLLSDMILGMFGSLAGSESLVLAFGEQAGETEVTMVEAPHGAALALHGKNIANPMVMILAGAGLLSYIRDPQAERASRAIYEAVFEAVHAGHGTPDLGGSMTTTEFTEAIVQRVGIKLQVWADLGQ